jgi:hypothetical protein
VSNQIGIDKAAFLISAHEVTFEPHFPATVQNPVDAATGEPKFVHRLYFNGQRFIKGQKAFYNTPDFQMTIQPGFKGAPPICILQFSAGAFSDSNEVPLGEIEFFQIARDVQAALHAVGCYFPIEKATLARLDLARNVVLSHPIPCYSSALGAMGARKRVNKMDFGGTGLLFYNGQFEIALYDKGEEMKVKHPKLGVYPENTLRPECRYMRGRSIRSAMGFDTLDGLKSAWETLHPAYMKSLERDVFRPQIEERAEATLDYYAEAQVVMEGPLKRKRQAFTNEVGMLHSVKQMGLEAAKHFYEFNLVGDPDSDAGKRQVRRTNAMLDQIDHALRISAPAPEQTPIKELYDELKRVVLS